jgi:mRNA interferase RelE/StbE
MERLLALSRGDYRVIARIEDDRFVIFVVRVAHRREVYR